jgi:hypothetical protein
MSEWSPWRTSVQRECHGARSPQGRLLCTRRYAVLRILDRFCAPLLLEAVGTKGVPTYQHASGTSNKGPLKQISGSLNPLTR